MAKEYYQVSYKTYFNERVKPVLFQGKETYPLYVQVTYDRKTAFFKSYYFDLFTQPKYDHLKIRISELDGLESRVINFITANNADDFSLELLSRQYKILAQDILDTFEPSFKKWMAWFFKEEGLPGLAAVLKRGMEEISAFRLWEELKISIDPALFKRMEEEAVWEGGPYFVLAAYTWYKFPDGPFCLPLHEWIDKDKHGEIREFIGKMGWEVDMGRIMRAIRLLYPNGIDSK